MPTPVLTSRRKCNVGLIFLQQMAPCLHELQGGSGAASSWSSYFKDVRERIPENEKVGGALVELLCVGVQDPLEILPWNQMRVEPVHSPLMRASEVVEGRDALCA